MYVYYYFIHALYEWATVQIMLFCFALGVEMKLNYTKA